MQNGFDDFTADLTAEEVYMDEQVDILLDLERMEREEMAEQETTTMLDRLDNFKVLGAFLDRKKEERGMDGYAYCAGFFESSLADALEELSRHDPHRAQQILDRFNKK